MDLLYLARTAADHAAHYLRSVERPADPAAWTVKGSRDFVTEVDRSAERIVSDLLLAAEPSSRVVGEELSPEIVHEGLVWIVDPLDGTTNFLHDFPAYAVSIAAALDGELQAGVVLHVSTGEVYSASRGSGAWLGDRRLTVSAIGDPAYALIGTGFPFKGDVAELTAYQAQFGRVTARTSGIRRAGSAALDLAHVAAGRFEGFWELSLSAWDIAAGVLLVREAGGVVTDIAGRAIGAEHTSVVAGNAPIHDWLMNILRA